MNAANESFILLCFMFVLQTCTPQLTQVSVSTSFTMCFCLQHIKTMERMWGKPGAGAPLSLEQKDFARKQKCK